MMLRLSLPSQYNSNAAPPTCQAGGLRTLPTGVAAPLRDNWVVHRRGCSQWSIECAVETLKLGQAGGDGRARDNWVVPRRRFRWTKSIGCAVETLKLGPAGGVGDGRVGVRRPGGVSCCSRVEALPWSVQEMEERFGQAGVKFVEAAGYKIVEMRLNEGSSARVVLQSALVASYKSGMWHGGVEELLYTAVVPGVEKPTTVGGVALRVWEAGVGRRRRESSLLASTECWHLEDVRSDPSQFVQMTLSTTSESQGSAGGAILQFKYVFTLTEAALSCALITTNVGTHAVSIHGSFQTSVAVNFVDGVYALGLQDYEYRTSPLDENVVEKEEMVRMKGGMDRVYTDIGDSVSLLDRGKRRTINFHSIGFEDVRISNPGEESGLEDWDSFVCIEFARLNRPVHLQPGEEWRAAKQLENPSK